MIKGEPGPGLRRLQFMEVARFGAFWTAASGEPRRRRQGGTTPGLHNKIPAHKIFARGWVAQTSFFHR